MTTPSTNREAQLDVCELCGSHDLSELLPTEMMRGDGGPFRYVFCASCGTTYQPVKLDDYGRYYPDSYYSFRFQEPQGFSARLRQLKRTLRNRYYFYRKGLVGRLLAGARPCPVNHLSRHIQLRPDMSILEVGSGTGELLHEIADVGVRRALGIDPFLPQDIEFRNGAKVLRMSIEEFGRQYHGEKFDLIMFNHSLEHSPTPQRDLQRIVAHLAPGGEVLVRLPVSDSAVSREYGRHWWSLDAPRHIYVFSTRSMSLLARQCGLNVKRVHFEGAIDDYLASEQHKAGIPLLDERSYVVTKRLDRFSQEQLREFQERIDAQNADGSAAQAGFVLAV
jgi:SAM-dependent methyltransferase